ncbi:PASTA domain-containing protein [Streptomyces sp. CA-288835]|uniref:PASTA domain-containing protein n=1 Tax=Streptomyces sp. CA-288835 TaxID=3240069 RepID=UPI003D8CDA7F
MRTRTAIAALTAALLALTGCAAEDTSPAPEAPATSQDNAPKQDSTPTEDEPAKDEPAADDAPAAEAEPETAALPNLVGQDLQAAQDEAQAAGFYALDDQDASGQNRLQVLDRNWTVCSQEPTAGTHPTDTPVTLYAVKDGEAC